MTDVTIVTHGATALITEPSIAARRWFAAHGFDALATADHGARVDIRWAMEITIALLDDGLAVETKLAN